MRRPGNTRRLCRDELLTLLDMLAHDTLTDLRVMSAAITRTCPDLTTQHAELFAAFTLRADAFRAELDKSLTPSRLKEKSEKALRLELVDLSDADPEGLI